MVIKVVELCWVDCIDEETDAETDERLTATRTVIYDSPKDTLLEAFQDYDGENFDSNKIIESNDDFDGQCLDTEKYLSIEEVSENY